MSDGVGALNVLEAARLQNKRKPVKVYQASSSEMYGGAKHLPINEDTEINPVSPYAISKAAAHWTCINYRNNYNLFICCGILFNHESVLRSKNFFIKKIVTDCLRIKAGTLEKLEVGNINISRDFGLAKSYVEAMYLMMQQPVADNYVICSGKSTSLKHIIEIVFDILDIPHSCLTINNKLFRPSEIDDIYGSPEKAKRILKWTYNYEIEDLMKVLVEEEIAITISQNRYI
jgi:GDPmannose 4,6-dehydratase